MKPRYAHYWYYTSYILCMLSNAQWTRKWTSTYRNILLIFTEMQMYVKDMVKV